LEDAHDVWITKNNPIYWNKNLSGGDKYFVSVDELKKDWELYQRQQKMVTIKNQINPTLFNFVTKVKIDDPKVVVGEQVLFNESIKGIKIAITKNNLLKNKFSTRGCASNCYCQSNYLHTVHPADLERLFLPNT
jgi:hypothetical protein